MPSRPIEWVLTIAVPASIVIGALILAGGGDGEHDAVAQASAACNDTLREIAALPQSPHSAAEGLEVEHGLVAALGRQAARLQRLAPRLGRSFKAGAADDQALYEGLSAMLSRPDFEKLSLTLPGHPELVPSWLKRWTAHQHPLVADARSRFSDAGVSACVKSQG